MDGWKIQVPFGMAHFHRRTVIFEGGNTFPDETSTWAPAMTAM